MESPSTCSTKNRGFKPVPVEKAQTKVSKMQANVTMAILRSEGFALVD